MSYFLAVAHSNSELVRNDPELVYAVAQRSGSHYALRNGAFEVSQLRDGFGEPFWDTVVTERGIAV